MPQTHEKREGGDTSMWSPPPGLHGGYDGSHDLPDLEDTTDSPEDKSPGDKQDGPKPRRKGPHKQKANYTPSHQGLKLPPIKHPQLSKPKIQCDNLSCIQELNSQVWDLQQQLSEAKTENKLLKRLQHRHMVALQHFQDSGGRISQTLTKHNNETRALQGLLRETRACRDNLARQLQATENKLLSAKASLQHLQVLSQDDSLLEREELTFRLTKATIELQDKDRRIEDLERNLELCEASFNRQIVTQQRKINEARKSSCYLQEQVYQLNREIQDRQRKLETYNIYSNRFQEGPTKKGKESKMVQTDELISLPTEAASVLELQHAETEETEQTEETEEGLEEQESSVDWYCYNTVQESLVKVTPEIESSANAKLEENHPEDIERHADTNEQNRSSAESLRDQSKGDCAEQKDASEAPQALEEEAKETKEHKSEVSYISEKSLNTTEPKRKGYRHSKISRSYTFKQSIENMHNGIPAYSSVDLSPRKSTKSPMRARTLVSSTSFVVYQLGNGEEE